MGRKLSNLLTSLRPEWALFFLIIVAAGLRLWQLDILPPGLFFDEAYNGLDANRVLTGVSRPVFFAGNNGREPLFIYLQALSVALVGASPLALRITSAVIGIVTVPIIYFAARIILPIDNYSSTRSPIDARLMPWLSLVAAAGIAVSYWHLSLSRVGFRAILLVPVSALAIAFFWRAWTRLRWRDFLWSGIWFGVAFYTYTSARVLPFVVLTFMLIELVVGLVRSQFSDGQVRALWGLRLKGLLLMGVVAGLIVAPLIWVISQDPTLLSARTGDVSIFSVSQQEMPGDPGQRLLSNVVAVTRSFYDQGDQNPRHNLPGRPVNDPWLAILFSLGWISAVWRIRLARNRFLLIWLTVMLMPTVLSTEAPHSLRSIGALPPVAMFYAVGAETLYIAWIHLKNRMGGRLLWSAEPDKWRSTASKTGKVLPFVVMLLVLVVSGRITFNDYFHRYATSPAVGYSFETDVQLAAQETVKALAEDQGEHAVLLSDSLFSQPQLRFALGQPVSIDTALTSRLPTPEPRTQFIFDNNFDPRRPLVLLWREGDQVKAAWTAPMVLPANEAIQQEQDGFLFPRSVVWPNHQIGWPTVFTGLLPDQAQFCPQMAPQPLQVDFANGMRLVGYDIEEESPSGGSMLGWVYLTLYWQQQLITDERYVLPEEQATLHDFGVSAHLIDNRGIIQRQDGPIETENARDRSYVGGRVVKDVRMFLLPLAESLDQMSFVVRLFELDTRQPFDASRIIPIVQGDGGTAGGPSALYEQSGGTTAAQTDRATTGHEEMVDSPVLDADSVVIRLSELERARLSDTPTCFEAAEQWPFLSQAWAGGSVLTAQMTADPSAASIQEKPKRFSLAGIWALVSKTGSATQPTAGMPPLAVQEESKRFSLLGIRALVSKIRPATQPIAEMPPLAAQEDPYWFPLPKIRLRSADATPAAQSPEIRLPNSAQLERYRSSIPGVRYPADARFANGMRLIAYDLQPDFVDPESDTRRVRLSLFWEADAPNPGAATRYQDVAWWNVKDFDVFVNLTDGNAVWQTANRRFADKQIMARGGIVESVHEIVIPREMPIGKAHFETGLYYYSGAGFSATVNERIPIVYQAGQRADNMVTLGGVVVGKQSLLDDEPTLPIRASWEDYIELSDLRIKKNADGSQMDVVLGWRALDRPGKDYTAFVHLVDQDQTIVAQHDQPPGGVANPTHLWAPNEVVRASFPLQLPPDVELEELTLRIGLYDPVTGDRMRVLSLANDQISVPDGTYLVVPLAAVP